MVDALDWLTLPAAERVATVIVEYGQDEEVEWGMMT